MKKINNAPSHTIKGDHLSNQDKNVLEEINEFYEIIKTS